MKTTGLLTPLTVPQDGVWLQPDSAAKYFKNGKGITKDTLMNKIYAGKLIGRVKNDYTGWYVFIPFHAIEQYNELHKLRVA